MRVVLVGTGTGIGKTHVGCALLEAWSEGGVEAVGLKPIETGVAPDDPLAGASSAGAHGGERRKLHQLRARQHVRAVEEPSDQVRLWSSSQLFHVKRGRPSTFHVKRSLYAFPEPVSPHLAARNAGTSIDLGAVQAWIVEHRAPTVVIETAGGLFSPLSNDTTNLDLVATLAPAIVLLVAPDRLGVLHDVAATIGYAATRGLSIRGVILSAPGHPDPSTDRNADELARLAIADPIAVFPRQPLAAQATRMAAAAALRWIEQSR
jgi:dethiobiotin synthetase